MQRLISALCLFLALLVSSSEAFAQARSPVTPPPATRPAPSIVPEEYTGTFEDGGVKNENLGVGGTKITYSGRGSESSRQAAILHERGVNAALAARQNLVNSLPKTVEKIVVKKEVEVRHVAVPTPPIVIHHVRPYPVRVYHNGFYIWD